jgi:hypothetical protein
MIAASAAAVVAVGPSVARPAVVEVRLHPRNPAPPAPPAATAHSLVACKGLASALAACGRWGRNLVLVTSRHNPNRSSGWIS